MANLVMMNWGNYTNANAVSNVLKYILRVRKNETRKEELISFGGMGVTLYAGPDEIIQEFLYVQKLFRIDVRKGRRIYHEVMCLTNEEVAALQSDIRVIHQLAQDCCCVYYQSGYQVVFAIHWDKDRRFHIHFVVNTICFYDGRKWHTSMEERAKREQCFNAVLQEHQRVIMLHRMAEKPKEAVTFFE